MTQTQGCAFHSSLAIVEIEQVKRAAEKQDKESVDNHLSVLEKQFENVGLLCGIMDTAEEKQHLANIRKHLDGSEWQKIDEDAHLFEKKLVLRLAKQHVGEQADPLNAVPARTWNALDKY